MTAGFERLLRSLRIPGRVLPWLLLALLCARPGGFGAEIRGGTWVQPAYAAEQAQPAAATAGGGEVSGWVGSRWLAVGLLVLLEALVIAGLVLERIRRGRVEGLLAERFRFESLLSELSARLIPVSLGDVDSEIERGLQRVVEFLRMDRASLIEYVPAGTVVRIAWAVEGVERVSPILEPGQFPWAAGRVQSGEVVRFSRIDELPQEAAATDRKSFQALGIRSSLTLPLSVRGSMLGVLAFDSLRAERTWSDELVQRLQLLGEVFAGALERKRLELLLAERLRFETLLSEQSATFSSLSATEVDREIKRALRGIADFFRADWGSLAELSHDTRVARITHSWVTEGAAPRPSTVSLADIPWVMARLQGGEMVRFSRVEELPADAAAVDRETYRKLGITSQVEVPLKVGGALLGTLTFSTLGAERAWPDELVQRLQLLGEVFANVLSRRQSEMGGRRAPRGAARHS